ncbi:hypothetical protein LINGRAHAP2_LOCUS14398 [Linum grandiflorum]
MFQEHSPTSPHLRHALGLQGRRTSSQDSLQILIKPHRSGQEIARQDTMDTGRQSLCQCYSSRPTHPILLFQGEGSTRTKSEVQIRRAPGGMRFLRTHRT